MAFEEIAGERLPGERLPFDTEPLAEEGVDLVVVFVALFREWRTGLVLFLLVALVGIVKVHSLKSQYIATATFLPSQGHSQADTLSSIFSPRGPGNLYIGLLQSRTVQDNIIDQNHLLDLFHTRSYEAARGTLAGKSTFAEGGDSIITIAVRDGNAQDAAMLANAYLQALQDLSDRMAQVQAAQTREFYDHQLQQQRAQLDEAEEAYARLQERTGQVASGAQASEGISTIASVRSQVNALNVQLAALKQSETEQNPEIQRLRSQIAQLEAQGRSEEAGAPSSVAGAATPANRIPAVTLALSRAQRAIADRTAVVNSLNTQFQSARLSEDFSHAAIEVIDRAYPPEGRIWPPRQNYYLGALALAAFVALFGVVLKLLGQRVLANPRHQNTLGRLRRAF